MYFARSIYRKRTDRGDLSCWCCCEISFHVVLPKITAANVKVTKS